MKEFLYTLLRSLNAIEVKGKNNIDILLGCMSAVEHEIAKIEAEESVGEETEVVTEDG